MTKNRASLLFLLSLTAVALCFGFIIMKPFLKPIVFASALAIVFYPLNTQVRRVVHNPNGAALLSTFLVVLAMIIPSLVLGQAITRELTGLYQSLSGTEVEDGGLAYRLLRQGEQWMNRAVQGAGLTTFDIRAAVRGRLQEATTFLLQQAAGLLGNLMSALLGAVVTAFTLFFLFREGTSLRQRLTAIVPLTDEQTERLFKGVHDVVAASVYGILAIGILQGLLLGIGFWVLDLPSPVLWGTVTAFLSLVPVVGTGGVWIPAVIILMAGGHWVKAVILVAWAVAIVHPVDNIVRPWLVGRQAKLSPLYLFFAILGGVKAFGLIGLLVGPVVLSVTIVLFSILRDQINPEQSIWYNEHDVAAEEDARGKPL